MNGFTERGKWMIRKYVSGNVIEKSKFWVPEQTKPRAKKAASSSHRKQDENDQAAVKVFARLTNCNFSHGDLWLTLSWSDAGIRALCEKYGIDPDDIDAIKKAADKELMLFLRRMKRHCGKNDVDYKYLAITSDLDGETGELTRVHCHVLMPRATYELCVQNWHYGTVDYQLLRNQDDYTPLAIYICKQCRRAANEHRWHASRNLKKPEITETETHAKGELHIPRGAKALDIGHYDIESGNHYVRYTKAPAKAAAGKERKTENGHSRDGVQEHEACSDDLRRKR